MKYKTFPILLAFLVMGVADAMGPMSDAVKKDYDLSNVMSTLLSFFVFIAFAVFSVPGGVLAARIGKKNLLLLGLGINALAVLIPALYPPTFAILLACIFLLGIGTTFLQVSGNPIMRDVRPQGLTAATSASLRESRASAARHRRIWSASLRASRFSQTWAGGAHSPYSSFLWPSPFFGYLR